MFLTKKRIDRLYVVLFTISKCRNKKLVRNSNFEYAKHTMETCLIKTILFTNKRDWAEIQVTNCRAVYLQKIDIKED